MPLQAKREFKVPPNPASFQTSSQTPKIAATTNLTLQLWRLNINNTFANKSIHLHPLHLQWECQQVVLTSASTRASIHCLELPPLLTTKTPLCRQNVNLKFHRRKSKKTNQSIWHNTTRMWTQPGHLRKVICASKRPSYLIWPKGKALQKCKVVTLNEGPPNGRLQAPTNDLISGTNLVHTRRTLACLVSQPFKFELSKAAHKWKVSRAAKKKLARIGFVAHQVSLAFTGTHLYGHSIYRRTVKDRMVP